MAVELYWDDDTQTTLLAQIGAGWQWPQAMQAFRKVRALADEPGTPFQAAIVDVRRGGFTLPDPVWSPVTLRHAREIAALAPQGTGPIVVVGAPAIVQRSFQVFRRLYPQATANVHVADTLDTARRIIARQIAAGQGAPASPRRVTA